MLCDNFKCVYVRGDLEENPIYCNKLVLAESNLNSYQSKLNGK